MGQYDFDTPVDRRGTDSLKWDVAENELPMWVADMDFKTAPEIIAAINKRLEHGVFGYADLTDEWYEAYQKWWRERHDFDIDRSWLIFSTGVIPSLSSIVRKLTTPNEKVIIQTPVYNIFFNSIVNNGCRPLESPLVYKDGQYEIEAYTGSRRGDRIQQMGVPVPGRSEAGSSISSVSGDRYGKGWIHH